MLYLGFQDPRSPAQIFIDSFHNRRLCILLVVCVVVFGGIVAVCNNCISFRDLLDDDMIEFLWTLRPVCVLLIIVMPSLKLLYTVDDGGKPQRTTKVLGHQWYWQYDYPDGSPFFSYLTGGVYRLLRTDNRLLTPACTTSRVLIRAADVLHSWTVPTIGVKADAVPGRVNKLTLHPLRAGLFFGQCREICGRNHRFIPISIECYLFNCSFALKAKRAKVKIRLSLPLQLLMVLLSVAFYTLLERKLLGYVQTRKGPNKPRLAGLVTPFADAIKLITKEALRPSIGNRLPYSFIPVMGLTVPCLLWLVYPSWFPSLLCKFSSLWFLRLIALGVFVILGAGWFRNSKFSIMGAVRAVAQSISYEVRLTLIIVHSIILFSFRLKNDKLIPLVVFLFLPILLLWISSLAETNRSPFDFSEGESELVRGFNTEYRSSLFVMIFLSEYMSILFISTVVSLLFNIRSGWDLFLFRLVWAVTFVWARGTLPRLRYDQLISMAWKCFLPFVMSSASILFLLSYFSKRVLSVFVRIKKCIARVFYTNKDAIQTSNSSFCIMKWGR